MTYLILILTSLFVFFGFRFLIISARKIHKKLDLLETRANNAENEEDLKLVYQDLILVSKECWHTTLSYRAIVVSTIIKTKLIFIEKLNK